MSGPGAGRGARSRPGGVPRPRRAFGPVVVSVVTMVGWVGVAHNSGSGWVQALGALLGAFLLIGLLGPAVAVRRARCRVVHCPSDTTAGVPATVVLEVSAPVEVRPLRPPGPVALSGRSRTVEVELVPERRGVVTACTLRVGSAAPFGLLWWTRRVHLALPRPLVVAPRLGPPDADVADPGKVSSDEGRRVAARVGEPRGVRPYRPGDLRHWVHWPATAHTGELMVREMEQPASSPLVLRAELPLDPDRAEEAAGRHLGTVAALLAQGRAVMLVTYEPDGEHRRTVDSVVDAGRRLAVAEPFPTTPGARR